MPPCPSESFERGAERTWTQSPHACSWAPWNARPFYGYATVADTVDPFGYDAAGRGLELATELGDDRLRSLFLALVAVGEFFTDFQKAWDLAVEMATNN